MQEKIKQAYEKINISKEAKDRIQMAVMMQNAEEKKKRQMHHGWKIAMAACLLAICIVPYPERHRNSFKCKDLSKSSYI